MMSPAGSQHGRITSRVCIRLGRFVEENALGVVMTADPGFHIARDPDTVRAPDVAFVSAQRAIEPDLAGFYPGPPDLAVEVVSPSDRAGEVVAKAEEWLAAGCRVVWVIDPPKKTIAIYRQHTEAIVLNAADRLDCPELLPGFGVPVAEVFAV